MMFRFNKNYFVLALLLFAIEIVIGVFVHDTIVRPYIGDLLVVILLYCLLKSFYKTGVVAAGIAVLLFAYTVELLQYAQLVKRLGLEQNSFAIIIIGASFEWMDMLMYTAGIGIVLIAEWFWEMKKA